VATPGPIVAGPATQSPPLGSVSTPQFDVDASDWRAWWERNRRSLLDLKRHAYAPAAKTNVGTAVASGRPSLDKIRAEVIPALIDILHASHDPELTHSALFALARLGEESDPLSRARILQALKPALKIGNQPVLEGAVLALGAFGSDEQAQELSRILDGAGLQDLMRDSSASDRIRSLAALGLALIGHRSEREDVRRFVVHHLVRGLQRVDYAGTDVDAACALGLGIVPVAPDLAPRKGDRIASGSRQAQVRALLDALQSKDAHRSVRAHAATSLGRLLDGTSPLADLRVEAVDVLADLASRKRRADAEVVQSAVLALGHVGDADAEGLDRDLRAGLIAAGDLSDGQARGFSMIALAEAASRPGLGEQRLAGARDAAKHLALAVERDRSGGGAWASVALGTLSHGLRKAGEAPPPEALVALRHALEKGTSTDARAAACVGLGLSGDRSDTAELLATFHAARSADLRGWAALGLGLLDARDTIEDLRAALPEARNDPRLLEQIATALVLLEDKQLVPTLLDWTSAQHSREAQQTLHAAIGLAGDERAIDPLLTACRDVSRSDRERALAVRALGEVADADSLPWSAALLEGVNYRAHTSAMADACGLALRVTE
jgi:HEAT repeat protein